MGGLIEVVQASVLGEARRTEIAEIFVDGYREDFSRLSRDQARLVRAFAHMLRMERFHVGLLDGTPAGITSLTNGRQLGTEHDPREFRRYLGLVRGTIASRTLGREFERLMPAELRDDTVSIEFVATAERFRGRGVALAILRHFLQLPAYRSSLIEEVADTNEAALRLYRKHGFTEYRRQPVRHTWISGIHAYVSLRLTQG